MSINIFMNCCILFAPVHFIVCTILSKELVCFEPNPIKIALLILITWLIPIIGAFYVYKLLNLSWFETPTNGAASDGAVIGGGMLELNAILNPKYRHVIEAKEKESIEQSLDGQLYPERPKQELTKGE